MKPDAEKTKNKFLSIRMLFIILIASTFWIYYHSNPNPQFYYDYTFRVADNILRGAIGFHEKPPSWVNEFVPFEGSWYSVFPLGSVLTMIPFAFLKSIGIIYEMPASFIAALTASAICFFLIKIAGQYEFEWKKRILLVCGILFGTWMWTNLMMAGAWQLALGFAVLGQLGAIYFTVFNRHPLLAGLFFGLAFGNRTEILLTAPLFLYLLWRDSDGEKGSKAAEKPKVEIQIANRKSQIANLARFCAVPFILGVSTLIYNYVRFHSFTDFGYARIPGVLTEDWYARGIFSIWYIPVNFREMLYTPWSLRSNFPYLVPGGFGNAIWLSSPFLLLLFRFGARGKIIKYISWTAILVLTLLLWIHGNPGGWQFGYRYAMILLPWMFVILLENSPPEIRWYEWLAYIISIFANAFATYLFFWTDHVKP